MTKKNLSTIAVRGGIENDGQYNAVVPPIYLSSTYAFEGFDQKVHMITAVAAIHLVIF